MAVAISRGSYFTPQKIHPDSASSSSLEMHATPEYFKARKMSIYYQFLLYGAPKEEQWVNVNLINTIMINLCIPRGGFLRVRAIVSGLALRHGHRWARANGKGESVSRRTGRDRKDTFHSSPVHPDALPSLNRMLLNSTL